MMSVLLSRLAVEAARSMIACTTTMVDGVASLLKEWRYRSDIHKLHAMSDRQLNDIGLTRSRIEDAVRGGARSEIPRGRLRSLFHP